MNPLAQAVIVQELERAKSLSGEALTGLNRLRATATITGDVNLNPIHRAAYHLRAAIQLLDISLGHADPEPVPTLADHIAAAKKLSCPVTTQEQRNPDADRDSTQEPDSSLLPAPIHAEKSSVIKTLPDTPSCEGGNAGAGEANQETQS